MHRLVDGLIKWRFALLATGLILTAAAWPVATRLQFDQSIESLYAPDDPYLLDYQESKRLFGGDEFVIIGWQDPNLMETDQAKLTSRAAQDMEEFVTELNEIPGVRPSSTQDLADALNVSRKQRVEELLAEALYGDPYKTDYWLRIGLRTLEVFFRPAIVRLVESILISEDRSTTAVVLRLEEASKSRTPRGDTIALIRERAAEHDPPAAVVGEPVQVHDLFRYVERDGFVLFVWSLVLLSAVLLILFLNVRWVLLPLTVVVVTIVATRAILVISGLELSMVSSMLNSLATIIAISTVTHVVVRFREYRPHHSPMLTLRKTLVDLSVPVFWTCATTAVGFAALMSSEITPVRSFGLMMSLATIMVLLVVGAMIPGGAMLGRFSFEDHRQYGERIWDAILGQIAETARRWRWPLLVLFTGIMVFGSTGLTRLQVETDFSKNFREETDIVQSLNFVETELGGAGTWEVNFPAPKRDEVSDEELALYLERVRRLAHRLRTEFDDPDGPELTKVIALTDGLDLIPRRGVWTQFSLSKRLEFLDALQPEFQSSLYNGEEGRMRIVLRARERQPSENKLALMQQVQEMAREEFPEAKATGVFVLLAHLIDSLLADQIVSFRWAALGIGLMMIIALRSVRLGLVSLVPNLFPILLVIGGMGWAGVKVNIGTAMIASVSFGLTVDSSVHYLIDYRRARRAGAGVTDALKRSHQRVGRALVFDNLALMIGFTVLALSEFIPLVYFGVLVSVAMLGGLIGNLVLLPLLIGIVDRSPPAMPIADGAE